MAAGSFPKAASTIPIKMNEAFQFILEGVMRQIVFAAFVALAPGSALACPGYFSAQSAYASLDVERLRSAVRDSGPDVSCSTNIREQIGRWTSLALLKLSEQIGNEALLREAGAYSPQWMVQERLGHLERQRRNYKAAAEYYQTALADIDFLKTQERLGVQFGDLPALPAERRRVQAWSEEMQLFLAAIVRGSRASCGLDDISPGANLAPAVFPITFVTDSDRMTADGEQAARVLLDCLAQLPPGTGTVAVVGHADPRGDDRYNCRLSIRRAQAVVDFLRSYGLALPLRAVGRGEEEPYQPLGEGYAQAEVWAMSRRVEADVPEPGETTDWRLSCEG